MPEYMNAALSPRERAELLLKELTIDEKLAQVTGVFSIKGREREMAYFFKNGIGEISSLGFRMCQSVEEAAAWQIQLQKLVMDNSRLHIPAIFHMEGPSGRLRLSVARSEGQIPIYYNHPNGSAWQQGPSIGFKDYVDMPHTPRYPFGFGLSYTTFDYRDLKLSKTEVGPEEDVTVSLKLTNTGKCAGTEVVQLYLRDVYASMTRPVKELAGFARVKLEPGETKEVSFTLDPSQTAFLDEEMEWKIEKGEIEVQVGASSEDICLKDSFRISADRYISSRDRAFAAEVRIHQA